MKEAIRNLVARLKELGSADPRPASAADLERAKAAGFPDELLDFYRQCEPEDYFEIKQRIWSIHNALVENTDAVPGCALSPHGFFVFASTLFGDSYCVDTNVTNSDGRHPVVLFSHEVIEEDAPLAHIEPYRTEVAESVEDFLVKFTNETLSEDPSYG